MRTRIQQLLAYASILALTAAIGTARANEKEEKLTSESFIKHAALGNMFELRMAQLGMQKAQNEEVREFSRTLGQDHSRAMEKLQQFAQRDDVELPRELDTKHREALQKLESASGQEFDREFAKLNLKSHSKAIHKFEKASKELDDQAVTAYAKETLPALKTHLEKSKQVARSVGLDDAAIADATRIDDEEAVGGTAGEGERGEGTSDEKPQRDRNQGRQDDAPKLRIQDEEPR